MKFLVLNDIHAAATPPRGCRAIYSEDIFRMLEEVKEIAREQQVDVTISTGDMFHHKQGVADWLKERLILIFKDWPGEKLAIVGNHDLGPAGWISIPKQPMGVLFAAESFEWLREDVVREYNGVKVQWSPANWFDEIDEDPANFGLTRMKGVDWAIKISHGSLVKPRKSPYPFTVVPFDTVPTKGVDAILNGHIHNDQGITEVNDCIFVCCGSLGRVARDDYNYMRKMRIVIGTLTKEEMTFDTIPLTSAISPDELYLAKTAPGAELDEPMARFARDIEKLISHDAERGLDEAIETVGKGVDIGVRRRVKALLEEAGF